MFTSPHCPANNRFIAEAPGFHAKELAFFTTEVTEEKRRATEDGHYNFLGELRAPRKVLRGAVSLPKYLYYSVALSSSP